MSAPITEKKISIYIALAVTGVITVTDLIANGSVTASQNISLALIAFAGGRQVLKSAVGK